MLIGDSTNQPDPNRKMPPLKGAPVNQGQHNPFFGGFGNLNMGLAPQPPLFGNPFPPV